VHFRDRRSAPAVLVPPHAYYVLGDNRAESDDSRNWGVLRDADVVGKALVGIWPPRRL
jgi:signal peptidase I